jgi:hypothetical protein
MEPWLRRTAGSRRAGFAAKSATARTIAKRFMDEALQDKIAWTAARSMLERVTNDSAWTRLDPDLRDSIERLLEERGGRAQPQSDPE